MLYRCTTAQSTKSRVGTFQKKTLVMLAYVHFLLYFEDTDLATLAHLEITVAKCSTYSSYFLIFRRKHGFAFCTTFILTIMSKFLSWDKSGTNRVKIYYFRLKMFTPLAYVHFLLYFRHLPWLYKPHI